MAFSRAVVSASEWFPDLLEDLAEFLHLSWPITARRQELVLLFWHMVAYRIDGSSQGVLELEISGLTRSSLASSRFMIVCSAMA